MISLQDIETGYFDVLEMHFGKIYSQMKRGYLGPNQMAIRMASLRDFANSWVSHKEHFLQDIKHFWDSHADSFYKHLRQFRSLKVVYGDDLFPPSSSNIACSKGLYVDTILLTDPILRIFGLFKMMRKEQQITYLLRHILSVLNYRDFALADADPPILVIAPDSNLLEQNHQRYLTAMAEKDAISHFEAMFHHVFPTRKSLDVFLKQFKTIESLEYAISQPERFLFNIQWRGTIVDQIKRYQEGAQKQFRINIGAEGIGKMFYSVVLGRMLQINDVILKSMTYQCDLLIEDPTLWEYLVWKYHFDAERLDEAYCTNKEAVISEKLMINGRGQWALISNIDSKALIDLRKKGVLADFRTILRMGMQNIDQAKNGEIKAVFEQSISHIQKALKQHEKILRSAASKKDRGLLEQNLAKWSRGYELSILSALTGSIPLSIISSFEGKTDFTSGADFRKKGMDLIHKGKKLKRLPTVVGFFEKP